MTFDHNMLTFMLLSGFSRLNGRFVYPSLLSLMLFRLMRENLLNYAWRMFYFSAEDYICCTKGDHKFWKASRVPFIIWAMAALSFVKRSLMLPLENFIFSTKTFRHSTTIFVVSHEGDISVNNSRCWWWRNPYYYQKLLSLECRLLKISYYCDRSFGSYKGFSGVLSIIFETTEEIPRLMCGSGVIFGRKKYRSNSTLDQIVLWQLFAIEHNKFVYGLLILKKIIRPPKMLNALDDLKDRIRHSKNNFWKLLRIAVYTQL